MNSISINSITKLLPARQEQSWFSLAYWLVLVLLTFFHATAFAADQDGDGIDDTRDNCIEIANSDQRDSNGDGYGNFCDADLDGNLIVNTADFILLRNRLNSQDSDADFNGDGVVNVVDFILLRNSLNSAPGPSCCSSNQTNIVMRDWIRTNPGAGGTINMIGATASGILVTASDLSGVYVSLDKNGESWIPRGETNGLMHTTHMSALGFHPNDGDTFYVGTGNGVYKTNDKGETFDFISENIPDNGDNHDDAYVESIVAAKLNTNTNDTVMYVTYHKWDNDFASKISKTTDEGQTWIDVSFPPHLRQDGLRIVKLLVHPQAPSLIYAIAGMPRWGCSAAKAYRSTDGGNSWSLLENRGDVLDLDIAFDNPNILYMSTFSARHCADDTDFLNYVNYEENGQATNGKLYKSSNQGRTFGNSVFDKTGIISVGTSNPDKVKLTNILTFFNAYWMDDDATGTWKSNSAGAAGTWDNISNKVTNWDVGYGANPYAAYGFAFNGLNKTLTKDIFNSDRLYGAGGWTLATFDGGKNFHSLSTKKKNDDTWLSTGLENINGFALDVNDNDKNVIYMGGYDIGFWVSKNRGASWKWQYPFKDDLVTLNRYTWGASEGIESYEPDSLKTIGGSNVMTLLSDPDHANIVWSSFAKAQDFADAEVEIKITDASKNDRSGLFRSTDYGDTWTLSTIYNPDGSLLNTHYHAIIYGLSIDKSSIFGNRTLYVTIDGNVAKSTDDGRTWHIIREDGGLKFTAVSNNILYAGGKNGLWRFKNNTWTQMGGSLASEMMGIGSPMIPDISPQENNAHYDRNWNVVIDEHAWNGVHDIKIDPSNDNIVYVVLYSKYDSNITKGLYKTLDGGNSWTRLNLGGFESKYLRYITIDPNHPNTIFVTSSENINSGGKGGSSAGIFYSTDGGGTWHDATQNMAWKYGSMIEIDKDSERVWAWSPGTGVQYMDIK